MEPKRCALNASLRSLMFLIPLTLTLTACEWFTDFKRQPSVATWEPLVDSATPSRGQPQMSVAIGGTAMAGFQVSYGAFPATIDSMAAIPNPTPVSDSSLANGRKYFQINCAVCHGERAMGDGPATKFGMPGINLTMDITKARTDGYIFGMIRNGRGLMPPYNRIEEMDRWDVVNYLRALQGVNGRQVEVGPLAAPGVTGDKVPGATTLGPNREAPFFPPRSLLSAGQPATTTTTAPPAIPGAVGADSASLKPGAAKDSAAVRRARSDSARTDSVRGTTIR
jgi:mono/diheme cytochrome c family protein